MQTQITRRCVIEEEIEELGEKPLRCPLSGNWSTRQSVRIHGLVRDPPSLFYPLYLSPLNSYSNKAFRNYILSLRCPLSGNWSTRQSVRIHGLVRDPPSLIYPLYLSPLSSYSNKAFRNCILSSSPDPVTSSMLYLPSLTSSNASQQHQNDHLTLWKGVISV